MVLAQKTVMKIESFAPTIRIRYNFTFNFLLGATTLAKLAKDIEAKGKSATELDQLNHKAFVAGSIMQAVASIESDIWSLINHGPGHHLGNEGYDKSSHDTLLIIAETLEKEPPLKRCDLILQLIRGKKLDLGKQPMQDLSLLISLRNEITHFKSLWTDEIDRKTLYKELEKRDSTRPPYYPDGFMNFFPNICLNAYRAQWAVTTVFDFIEYFYKELGIKSSIGNYNCKLLEF